MLIRYIFTFLFLSLIFKIKAQQSLTKDQALVVALEQNFGIKVSRNTTEIVKNNSSILNSGYLPTVSFLGGSNYTESDAEIAFPGQLDEDGVPIPNRIFEDQESQRFNAGVNLSYTLFDGLGRKYNYKRLKEQYKFFVQLCKDTAF